MDFNDTPENYRAARERRLQIRTMIRAHNHERPRCAGCGNDMLVFEPEDIISADTYGAPGWEWLQREDLRPGDLLCFWCTMNIAELHGRYVWGHA